MTCDAQVAIVGGGPAGASAALELARRGIDAIVLERSDGAGNPVGECLAPTINSLLQRLELGHLLSAAGALPSHGNRSAWGGDGVAAERDFLREPFGHGWHLDRPAFNTILLHQVELAGITVWRGTRVRSVQRCGEEWSIGVEAPQGTGPISSRGLIDASGRSSIVARKLGMRRRRFDAQVAAIGVLEPEAGAAPLRDATTIIEAVENGWWYAALLPDGPLAVTYFTDPDLLAESDGWRAAGWRRQLRGSELVSNLVSRSGYRMPERVRVAGAGSSLLPELSGTSWVAAGDAAAAYDPLSSHGIGSALAAGQQAAAALAAALQGDASALPTYGNRIRAGYARYLWLRHAYYGDERRWPTAPYWRRRHTTDAGPEIPAAALQGSVREL